MKDATDTGIRMLLLVGLPLTVWLCVCSHDVLVALFQRGHFTAANAGITATLMILMSPYIIFSRITGVTQSIFYADLNTRAPMIASYVNLAVYPFLAWGLSRLLGLNGFAVAMALASAITATAMTATMVRFYGSLRWMGLASFTGRVALICAVGGCAAWAARLIPTSFAPQSTLDALVGLCFSSLAMAALCAVPLVAVVGATAEGAVVKAKIVKIFGRKQ